MGPLSWTVWRPTPSGGEELNLMPFSSLCSAALSSCLPAQLASTTGARVGGNGTKTLSRAFLLGNGFMSERQLSSPHISISSLAHHILLKTIGGDAVSDAHWLLETQDFAFLLSLEVSYLAGKKRQRGRLAFCGNNNSRIRGQSEIWLHLLALGWIVYFCFTRSWAENFTVNMAPFTVHSYLTPCTAM